MLFQIFSVAILLYTPLVCQHPIAVPILASYGGVLTRCVISLIGFYRFVFPKLSKTTVVSIYSCVLSLKVQCCEMFTVRLYSKN